MLSGGASHEAGDAQQSGRSVLLACGYFDVEQLRLMSRMLLNTLGTACVEKTYGDLLNSPASVVGNVKKEMLDYLYEQIEAFATESASFQASDAFPGPIEVARAMLDDFVYSQRNLLNKLCSRVVNTEKKEDRAEDFIQELEKSGAWSADRREDLARAIFRRLDCRQAFTCDLKFGSSEKLAEHESKCPLRPLTCANEGCSKVFSARHNETHDATCPFKRVPCELKCKALVIRGEMDKHCITVCPMKPVNCPFYHMGCINSLPQGMLEQHLTEFVGFHLLCVRQSLQKQEDSVANVTQRALLLEKALSISQRSEAVDIGTLSLTIREQDAKIKSLEQDVISLRKNLKAIDVSTELSQLHQEVRNLQKQIENQNLGSSGPTAR
eukprot:c23418_g1_i1 orf=116-1261(+)